MQEVMIVALINALMAAFDEKTVKSILDALMDLVETAVENSETKVDDRVLGPLLLSVRAILDIPDND